MKIIQANTTAFHYRSVIIIFVEAVAAAIAVVVIVVIVVIAVIAAAVVADFDGQQSAHSADAVVHETFVGVGVDLHFALLVRPTFAQSELAASFGEYSH